MRKRFLTMLLGLGLVLSMFVWALGSASADHTGTQEVYFPWVPNGAELTGQTDEFDGNTGLWYGTVTVQNLEDVDIEVDFYVGDPGNGFDFSSTWSVGAYASVTLSAADLGGSGDGFAVKAHGFVQREITEEQATGDDGDTETVVVQEEIRAHITGAAKNVSNQPSDTGKTNSGHIAVDGYSAMTENQVGGGTHVLPITQLNNNWNTHIRIARFDDSGAGQQVTVTFYDAFGSGQTGGSAGTFQVGLTPGEVETIDLSQVPGLDEDFTGSAWISAGSATVGAVAERIKQEDSMLLINTSRPSAEANGVKYAPLIFQNYNMWNTGISVANLSDSTNTVTINFHGPTSHGQISHTLQIAPRAMEFMFIPGLQEIGLDDDGFVGSAILTSESGLPFHAAIDQVKYYGSGLDVGHAMSYIAEHDTAGDGDPQHAVNDALALPIFSKGNNAGEGDTSGIQLFNASPQYSVNAHIWFYDQSGARVEPTVNNPRSVSLAPRESHTVYALHMPTMPENFWGSAIVQVSGEGELVAVSNNVNYSVQNDGSATYNLIRVPGEPQEPTATRATVDPVSDTNIWGEVHELTVTVYDQFDVPMEGVFVNANITEGPHVNFTTAGDVMSGTTGGDGQVILSYEGGNIHHGLSQDTITIDVDGISGPLTATKTWVFGDPTTIEIEHGDGTTEPAINVIYFEPHTVRAIVRDQQGNLLPGAEVTFDVDASDAGLQRLFLTSDVVTTNNDGEAEFEYVAQFPGFDPAYADVITASVEGVDGTITTDPGVVKVWRNLELNLEHVDDPVDPPNVTFISEHTVVATLTTPAFNFVSGPAVGVSAPEGPVEGAEINFDVSGANSDSGSDVTDANGEAFHTYQGENAGVDTITAELDVDPVNYNDSVTKEWFQLLVQLDHAEGNDAINPTGTYHQVVATLGFDTGGGFTSLVDGGIAGSYSGIQVNFEVEGPPNFIDSTPRFTNGDGEAFFTYFGAGGVGDDTITATLAVNGESDSIIKTWMNLLINFTDAGNEINFIHIEPHTVEVQVTDEESGDGVGGVEVDFMIFGANSGATFDWANNDLGAGTGNPGVTGDDGFVTFTYTGTLVGADNLQARFTGGSFAPQTLQKNWVDVALEIEHVDAELFDDETNAAVNQSGTDHTVQVTLVDGQGNVIDNLGDFDALLWIEGDTAGVFNTGASGGNAITLENGVATFTYNYEADDAGLGDTHDLRATLNVAAGTDNEIESNTIQKIWYTPGPWNLVLSAGEQYQLDDPIEWDGIDLTAHVTDQYGQDLPAGTPVTFTYVGSDPANQGALQDVDDGTAVQTTVALTDGNSEAQVTVVSDATTDDRPLDVTVHAEVVGTPAEDEITVTFLAEPLVITNIDLEFVPEVNNPVYSAVPNVFVTATVYDQYGETMSNVLVTFEMLDDMGATGPVNSFPNHIGLRNIGGNFQYQEVVTEPTDENGEATIIARKSIFTPAPANAFVTAFAGQNEDMVQATYPAGHPDEGQVHVQEIIWVSVPTTLEIFHADNPLDDTATNAYGEDHTVVAVLTDQYGFPVLNADIDFTADSNLGLADVTGTVSTGLNGQAEFEYTRPEVAEQDDSTDTITANFTGEHPIPGEPDVDVDSNAIFKNWVNWDLVLTPEFDENPFFSAAQINVVHTLIEAQLTADLGVAPTPAELEAAIEAHWLATLGESGPNQHTIVGTLFDSGGTQIDLTEDDLIDITLGGGGGFTYEIVGGQLIIVLTQTTDSTNQVDVTATVGTVEIESNQAVKEWTLLVDFEYDAEATFLTLVHPPGQDPVNPAGSDHTVLATLYDQFGQTISGEDIRFQIVGVNAIPIAFGWFAPDGGPPAGFQPGNVGPTDSNGQIAFNYVGSEVGIDEIVADWNDFALVATVQKEWVEPNWLIVGTTLNAQSEAITSTTLGSSVFFQATIHAENNPNLHPAPGDLTDGVNFQVCLLNQLVCLQFASDVAIDANGVATTNLVLIDTTGGGLIIQLLQSLNLAELLQLSIDLGNLTGTDLVVLEIVADAEVNGVYIESDAWGLGVNLTVADLLAVVLGLIGP